MKYNTSIWVQKSVRECMGERRCEKRCRLGEHRNGRVDPGMQDSVQPFAIQSVGGWVVYSGLHVF